MNAFMCFLISEGLVMISPDIASNLGEYATMVLEIIGIFVIISVALYALGHGLIKLVRRADIEATFREMRHRLIRGILLGLDFLVAADIIRTVAVELTFESVGVLTIIVLIRILLSFSLEVEMTGYWPWQKDREKPQR